MVTDVCISRIHTYRIGLLAQSKNPIAVTAIVLISLDCLLLIHAKTLPTAVHNSALQTTPRRTVLASSGTYSVISNFEKRLHTPCLPGFPSLNRTRASDMYCRSFIPLRIKHFAAIHWGGQKNDGSLQHDIPFSGPSIHPHFTLQQRYYTRWGCHCPGLQAQSIR